MDYNTIIRDALSALDLSRKFWKFTKDPGVGVHEFGKIYQLRISDKEIKKNKISREYLIELIDNPGHPLTICYDWDKFYNNLKDGPRSWDKFSKKERSKMNMSINDLDLRDKVRLKCKNDWDLDLNDDQISMCIIEMEHQKLSIFHDQIWPNKRKWKKKDGQKFVQMERITWDKSIDGYRAVAHRSGRFAGVDAPVFSEEDGGLIASITVYALDKNGNRQPYIGEARFNEFVQMVDEWSNGDKTGNKYPNPQWAEKPYHQLSVTAERQALRKAFQDLENDSSEFLPDNLATEPNSNRGQEESEDVGEPEPLPRSSNIQDKKQDKTSVKKAKETEDEKPAGKKVHIPSPGFRPAQMYNKNERIVMCGIKDGTHILALDSGSRVKINSDGYEIERGDRFDKTPGGRNWNKGDHYYNGAIVEKIADGKSEYHIWLALDDGNKVYLDRWGKELKKKDRKKAEASSDSKKSNNKSSSAKYAEPKDVEIKKEDPKPVEANAPVLKAEPVIDKIKTPPESDKPKDNSPITTHSSSITTIEEMRKNIVPLLKKWCETVLNRRVSPKEAYEHFTGLSLQKGQSMTFEDYQNLYQCLEDTLTKDEN